MKNEKKEKKKKKKKSVCTRMLNNHHHTTPYHSLAHSPFPFTTSLNLPTTPPPSHVSLTHSLKRHTRHRPGGIIPAPMPRGAAHARHFPKGHADARGAEEGARGAVVFAEVEVDVGAWEKGIRG